MCIRDRKWNAISTSSFAELESQIFEVENLNESFRFLKGKKAVVEAEATMDLSLIHIFW